MSMLAGAMLGIAIVPAGAQDGCTTNYCVKSQSVSFQTPPGWPAVSIETCCRTRFGVVPDGMDWSNGTPVLICTGNADYSNEYPNCGAPGSLSQNFPLTYDTPRIGIGVAWPNGKDYRYEVQSIPLVDGSDGTCARYANAAGKVADWWTYELKEPRRGSYVFTAAVSFRQGEKGFYAVLDNCRLAPPPATPGQ
jgi:hypothetical protein